jgi:phenylpropionate dioxygenase-like ring-hydroxylating dioxygenase large terminal subunit
VNILDHWYPIYLSRRLGKKPVAVKRLNRDLVLFRAGSGAVGVLPDCCPHRGMRLSNGRVKAGQLVCPYHGWCFDASGLGQSPGSPKLHVQTPCFEVAEHRGVVWIKNPGGAGVLPPLTFDGYEPLYTAYFPMKAPVEALMENFTEIEHTGPAHWQFGYAADRMTEVKVESEASNDTVRTRTEGPQMRLWFLTEWTMGMRSGDCLKFDWTTRFAPLHTSADFWWEEPRSHQPRPFRFKEVAFFVPVGPEECLLVSFYFWSCQGTLRRMLRHLYRPFVKLAVGYEISIDKWLIENVIPQSLHAGRRLGRFDKGLHEQRKRWHRCCGEDGATAVPPQPGLDLTNGTQPD